MPVPIPVPLRGASNTRLEAKYNVITDFPSFDLHAACATGNIGLVEYALGRGQPINGVIDGILPIHAAASGGSEAVVRLLLQHGASVNAPRLPRRYSNEKGKDATIVGASGSTPLHFAAANGHSTIVSLLVEAGAVPDRADKHGVTPEQLAIRNGWLECAGLLRNYVKERAEDVTSTQRTRHGSFIEADQSSKRVRVKQSVDHALNLLKVKGSSSALSEIYSKTGAASTNNLPATSAYPESTRKRSLDYGIEAIPGGGRRPSITASPRANAHRPSSAGTGASRPEHNSPKGSTKKLNSKYSLLSLFKRNEGSSAEHSDSFSSSNSNIVPSPPMETSPKAQPIPITPQHGSFSGSPPMGSETSGGSLPSVLHPGSAVDLHNIMARRHRDRSASASSRFESIGLGLDLDSSELSSSPPARRPRAPSHLGHHHARSTSTNRNGAIFEDDVVINPDEKLAPPSILRVHTRSSSNVGSNERPINLRALRFDSSASDGIRGRAAPEGTVIRQCSSTNSLVHTNNDTKDRTGERKDVLPKSAPANKTHFKRDLSPEDDLSDEDDEDYGRAFDIPSQKTTIKRTRGQSFSSLLSDASSIPTPEFPFSIHEAPPHVDAETRDGRYRGNSVSSTGTNSRSVTSGTTSGSGGSFTATPPEISPRTSLDARDIGLRIRVDDHDDSPGLEDALSPVKETDSSLGCEAEPISSHAQAEARVQQTQRDILDHEGGSSESSKLTLSAMLAAYGESLAQLRELQETAGKTDSPMIRPRHQRSLDDFASTRRLDDPPRPHTSMDRSSSESLDGVSDTDVTESGRHRSRSDAEAYAYSRPAARLPAGSLYNTGSLHSRRPALDHASVDSSDAALSPVSTTFQSRPPSPGMRLAANSTKLSRMGLIAHDVGTVRIPTPPQHSSGKRFGGLKSLLQPFKSK
ncbi:hypothetical protein CYLTODRAFT_441508 [Cylindrobasidium torrendii FP15055 ss-10]|uniref:Uncharacterized protein n=1 Tax=Cylindrobasidium torrendii FP15055 ss-10 TaxID=1314674 RepID=A0A0D7BLP3_9AGAR|nr:hypothetical protein CYLTODRAFT_441508 [Cylindrobasidium torrendii FP15055 ss-10]